METTQPATVRAELENGQNAELLVDLRAGVSVTLSSSPAQPIAGQTVTFTVSASQSDGTRPTGVVRVSYGDGGTRQQPIDGTATMSHVYAAAGSFVAEVELTAASGETATARSTVVVLPVPVTFAVAVASSPAQPTAGDAVTFTVTASRSDGAQATGSVRIDYGDGSTYQQPISGTATMSHTYAAAGSFTADVEFTATTGETATATRAVVIQAGASPPAPPPPAPTPPSPTGADEIDLNQVIWLHHDVSGWAQTSTITGITHDDPPICIEHTMAGAWPVIDDGGTIIEGNPWVFARINGQWYAGTYEWLRPGQTCKSIDADNIGEHIKVSPLDSWHPQSGEEVCFMVSTSARFGPEGPKNERSNVVRFIWP